MGAMSGGWGTASGGVRGTFSHAYGRWAPASTDPGSVKGSAGEEPQDLSIAPARTERIVTAVDGKCLFT